MLQECLHILVATAARHVRYGQEGACLGPCLAPVGLEAGLVAHVGIGINCNIVVSVALARINQEFVHGGRIHASGIGNQIGRGVSAGTHRLGIIRLDAAQVISGMRHSVDVHVHETLWRTGRKKENQIDDLSDETLLLLYQTSPEVYQTCPRNQRRSRYCRVREISSSKPEENATTIPLSNSEG